MFLNYEKHLPAEFEDLLLLLTFSSRMLIKVLIPPRAVTYIMKYYWM